MPSSCPPFSAGWSQISVCLRAPISNFTSPRCLTVTSIVYPLFAPTANPCKRRIRLAGLRNLCPIPPDLFARLSPPITIDSVSNSFEIGPVQVGAGRLFLIAGPCVIESETHVRTMAEAIQRITADLAIPCIFKASYDKANRTSVKSFRGPGLIEGVRILGRLAKDTGLPVLTDVHEPSHCEIAAEAVDVLQIPAFLCRQQDLLDRKRVV